MEDRGPEVSADPLSEMSTAALVRMVRADKDRDLDAEYAAKLLDAVIEWGLRSNDDYAAFAPPPVQAVMAAYMRHKEAPLELRRRRTVSKNNRAMFVCMECGEPAEYIQLRDVTWKSVCKKHDPDGDNVRYWLRANPSNVSDKLAEFNDTERHLREKSWFEDARASWKAMVWSVGPYRPRPQR